MTVTEQTAAVEASRFQTEPVVTLATAHGMHDTYFSFLPTMLPVLIEKFGLSNAEAGALAIFYQWPALIQPFVGYLADRANLRALVIVAPALSAAMVTLVGAVPGYGMVAFLLFIAGLSNSGFHAIVPAMIAHYSGRKVGRGMSIFMVGGELGFALGPLMVVPVIQAWGMQSLPLLMPLGLLASTFLFFRLRSASTWRMPVNPAASGLSLRAGFAAMRPVMLPLVGMFFINSFLYVHLSTYLTTFLTGEGSSLMLAGVSFSLFQLAGTLGTLVSGWMGDTFGRRAVLLFSGIATPLFVMLFLFAGGWWQIPALAGAGFASYCTAPTLMAMVQENFPTQRAMANGMYMMINFLVRSIVIILVGALADVFSLRLIFIASAFGAFLALPFIFMLPQPGSRAGQPFA